jgi:hypothetical protein
MNDKYVIEIKKRSWYEWLMWTVWLFVQIVIVQNALASRAELEPRAALISWIAFFALLIAGGVVWFMRRSR